jgi:hypothetical protein
VHRGALPFGAWRLLLILILQLAWVWVWVYAAIEVAVSTSIIEPELPSLPQPRN